MRSWPMTPASAAVMPVFSNILVANSMSSGCLEIPGFSHFQESSFIFKTV